VSFTCEVEREVGRPACPHSVIGADAGLRGTVLSNGEIIPNPQPLKSALKKIARLNREIARRTQGSKGCDVPTRTYGTSEKTRCTK
jgi:putative transposase